MIHIDVPDFKIWDNAYTLLAFHDSNGRFVSDYDLDTGLTFALNDRDTHFVTLKDGISVAGEWHFIGFWKDSGGEQHCTFNRFDSYGVIEGEPSPREYDSEYPWTNEYVSPKHYVSAIERESRLNVCRDCPLFDHETLLCSVDNSFMPLKTRVSGAFCPNDNWQQSPDYDPQEQLTGATIFDKDFEEFDALLDEFLGDS